jgi:hypothetical protein
MKKTVENETSRRSVLLQGITYSTAIAAILTADVKLAQAGKMGQKSVSYQATPKGSQKCSNCSLFEPPAACKSVAGTISPNGWCSIYRKA